MAVDDPAFAATRANAEPMIVDEPTITSKRFALETLGSMPITIALGSAPLELIADAATQFERWTRCAVVVVDAPHEVYLTDPGVLTRIITATEAP